MSNELKTATLGPFVTAYLTAAMWSSTIETEDRNSPYYDKSFIDVFDIDDIDAESVQQAIKDCDAFKLAAGSLLTGWQDTQAGHDFWLTRCGHGAGFWDRNELPNGAELSALVGYGTAFPTQDMYLGDDGKIYITAG